MKHGICFKIELPEFPRFFPFCLLIHNSCLLAFLRPFLFPCFPIGWNPIFVTLNNVLKCQIFYLLHHTWFIFFSAASLLCLINSIKEMRSINIGGRSFLIKVVFLSTKLNKWRTWALKYQLFNFDEADLRGFVFLFGNLIIFFLSRQHNTTFFMRFSILFV